MTIIRTQRFVVTTEWAGGSFSHQGPFDLGRATEIKRKNEKHPDAVSVVLNDIRANIAA